MRLSINSCCQAFTASMCVCSCMEARMLKAQFRCLRISSSVDARCTLWRHHCTILTHIDSDMKVPLCAVSLFFFFPPACTVVCEQALSKQNNFIATVNSTAFRRLNKNMKGFITVMKWIDGICELLTFTCLLAQWMSSKVNCVKPPLICSQRHGKDVGS